MEGRKALMIRDQQMRDAPRPSIAPRDAGAGHRQDKQEGRRLDTPNARIADLEIRAPRHSNGGREDLRGKAAEHNRRARGGRDACQTARACFAWRTRGLKRHGVQGRGAHHELESRPPHRPRLGSGSRLRRSGIEGRPALRNPRCPESGEHAESLRERQLEAQAADQA